MSTIREFRTREPAQQPRGRPPKTRLSSHHAKIFRLELDRWLRRIGSKRRALARQVKPRRPELWIRNALRATGHRRLEYETALDILRRLVTLTRQWRPPQNMKHLKAHILYEVGHFGWRDLAGSYDSTISQGYYGATALADAALDCLKLQLPKSQEANVRLQLLKFFADWKIEVPTKLFKQYERRWLTTRQKYGIFFQCMYRLDAEQKLSSQGPTS